MLVAAIRWCRSTRGLPVYWCFLRWLLRAGVDCRTAFHGSGIVLTLWCAYFFRDPQRATCWDDDLVISPADGRVSAVQLMVPPAELGLGDEPPAHFSIVHERVQLPCELARRFAGASFRSSIRPVCSSMPNSTKASTDNERNSVVIDSDTARWAWCRLPVLWRGVSSAGFTPASRWMPVNASA